MKIKHINKPFSYFIIDDFFDKKELELIMQEAITLQPYALDQSKTGSAYKDGKTPLKSGKGIFLDTMFGADRSVCKILNAYTKIFNGELCETLIGYDASFGHIKNSTHDTTLINYYGPDEEYHAHKDSSPITAVIFLEIGKFEGGGFSFPNFKETISFKHNRLVIFHGCVDHQAHEIKPLEKDSCRVSIAKFIGYAK